MTEVRTYRTTGNDGVQAVAKEDVLADGRKRTRWISGGLTVASIIESAPVTPPPPPQPSGEVIFDGGPLAGRAAWSNLHAVSESRVQVVEYAGSPTWKMTIQKGDNFNGFGARTELGTDNNSARQIKPDQDLWVGYSFLFPKGFDYSRWCVLTQHKDMPDQGGPTVGIVVNGGSRTAPGDMQVDGNISPRHPASGRQLFAQLANTPGSEKWHNVVLHIKTSTDATEGLLAVYYSTGQDKPSLIPGTDRPRQTWTPGVAREAVRLGLYQDSGLPTQSIYHRHFRIGSGFDAVSPVQPG